MKELKQWIKAGNTTIPNLLLMYYRQIGLTEKQLIFVIQLKSFIDAGNDFPETEKLAKRMQLSSAEVFDLLHELTQKKLLFIHTETDSEGKSRDSYRLDQIWEKVMQYLSQDQVKQKEMQQSHSEKELFTQFEAEFGRPLSPIEIQTIGMWLDEDHYSIELIELALREAVLSQVYNLKYVDRILLSWEKKNIRTKAQVMQEGNKKRSYQTNPQQKNTNSGNADNRPNVPLYNWLEEND